MNQEKIGIFISQKRHEQNLTQEELAEKLGISKNAVSKWERGICLMDMSLLKPLSEILDVEVIDILSGEKVACENLNEKYKESIDNLVSINRAKEKSFALYGFMVMYLILIIYNGFIIDGKLDDLFSLVLMTVSFKFFYSYKLRRKKIFLAVSIISFIASISCFVMYIISTI